MLTPEHHAAWMASVNEWRHIESDDLAEDRAMVLAVADHLAALEAQVAEARRLLTRYAMPFDPMVAKLECLSCGYRVSADATDAVVADHIGDCPVGTFLAATAPHGAGEATR